MLKVTFLGTGGSLPTTNRNPSAIAIQREGELVLFDCGEGKPNSKMDEELLRAKRYSKIKNRITFANIVLTFAFLIFMLASGASISLSNAAARWTPYVYAQIGLYLLIFGAIFYIVKFCLDLYDGFVVEHRFSLSNQTFWG